MDILNLFKTINGLSWNGQDKEYTTKYYGESYNIPDLIHIVIELNQTLYWFNIREITIDDLTFNDPIEVRNYLFII
jgi:hypothetical protein